MSTLENTPYHEIQPLQEIIHVEPDHITPVQEIIHLEPVHDTTTSAPIKDDEPVVASGSPDKPYQAAGEQSELTF